MATVAIDPARHGEGTAQAEGPRPRTLLATVPVPHAPREGREGFPLRLDLNEDLSGPLAPMPALRGAGLAMYPTTGALGAALARHLGLPETWIKVTAGADEGIYGLLHAYLDPGDALLLPWPTFGEFAIAGASLGARIERAPYGPDLAFPLASFRAALAQGPRVAVIVSPANPTGELIAVETILELAASAPGTLLIVDEAYAEYGGQSILEAGRPPANVAAIRTFSKVYGLAGARVGYVVARPAILDEVRKVLPIYSLAGPSLALALAGLGRQERLVRRVASVRAGIRRIERWGQAHGIDVHPSAANFVLLRLPDGASAQELARRLEERGVLVADRTAVLPGTLRVGVGAPRHVSRFLGALEEAVH
jgi:histidinol-phosphate aminotransferase